MTPTCVAPWTLAIDGWSPPSLNRLLKAHWRDAARMKRRAREEVAVALRLAPAPVPPATGPRRVHVRVTYSGRGPLPDPDNLLKALLDALVWNRLLVDDSGAFCELASILVERGASRCTVVIFEETGT